MLQERDQERPPPIAVRSDQVHEQAQEAEQQYSKHASEGDVPRRVRLNALPSVLCVAVDTCHANARLDGRPTVLGVGVDEHSVLAGLCDGYPHEVRRPGRIELSHFRLVRC